MARIRGPVPVGNLGSRDQPPARRTVRPSSHDEQHGKGQAMTGQTMPAQTMTARTQAPPRSHAVIESPIGSLTLVTEDGKLTGLYMDVAGREPDEATLGQRVSAEDDPVLDAAAGQLAAYFAGELTSFDLPLNLAGTGFQRTVWASLRD